MGRYIIRRLGYLVPVWLGISLLACGLANLARVIRPTSSCVDKPVRPIG